MHPVRLIGLTLFVLVLAFSAQASVEIRAVFAENAPVIDGALEDPIWAKAERHTTFYSLGGAPAKVMTEVMVAWDQDALYVAFKNHMKAADVRANVLVDGGPVWNDDENGIFINPVYPGHTGPWFEFAINSVPARTGLPNRGGSIRAPFWNAAAKVYDEFFVIEVVIEYAAFGFYPDPGDVWGINFTRHWSGAPGTNDEWITWSPLPTRTFLDTRTFGTVVFVK